MLGEFFENITAGFVHLVHQQRSSRDIPVPEAVPASGSMTLGQKMSRLGSLPLSALRSSIAEVDLPFTRVFMQNLLKMKSPWLDSTFLRNNAEVRDAMRGRSTEDRYSQDICTVVVYLE